MGMVDLCVHDLELGKQSAEERLARALKDAQRAHDTLHREFERRDELQIAIDRVLVEHRHDVALVFPNFAAKKMAKDKTPSGQLMGLSQRVAADLNDLLQWSVARISVAQEDRQRAATRAVLEAASKSNLGMITKQAPNLQNEDTGRLHDLINKPSLGKNDGVFHKEVVLSQSAADVRKPKARHRQDWAS